MVCLVDKVCSECGCGFKGNYHNTQERLCGGCAELKRRINKEAHMKFLDGLPLEHRVRRIEEWIYEFEKDKLPKLAKVPVRYA